MATRTASTKIEYGDHVREFGTDRICRAAGCMVRLSRYNPGPYCGIHVQLNFEKLPRHR